MDTGFPFLWFFISRFIQTLAQAFFLTEIVNMIRHLTVGDQSVGLFRRLQRLGRRLAYDAPFAAMGATIVFTHADVWRPQVSGIGISTLWTDGASPSSITLACSSAATPIAQIGEKGDRHRDQQQGNHDNCCSLPALTGCNELACDDVGL